MSYGKPMLIENIEEELDPMLDPVLEKRVVRKGKSLIIQMDKEVDFSESFSLFCTTRLPNPHYSPEMSAKVTSSTSPSPPSASRTSSWESSS